MTPGTPTQVAHPWRAVLRTFVAALIGGAVIWLASLGIDLKPLEGAMVESVTAIAYAAVTGFFTWLLARPKVDAFVEKYMPWLATGVHTEDN